MAMATKDASTARATAICREPCISGVCGRFREFLIIIDLLIDFLQHKKSVSSSSRSMSRQSLGVCSERSGLRTGGPAYQGKKPNGGGRMTTSTLTNQPEYRSCTTLVIPQAADPHMRPASHS